MREISYDEIKIATDDFSVSRLIGKGSHGSVYRGTLSEGLRVAIKKPSSPSEISKLDNEIDILSSIAPNPNLVNLVGVCHGPAHNLLVTDFMPNGSLHDLLHGPSSPPPPWARRMLMALQVARSVLSLHESRPASIVHRDIKSANVLLDERRDARLADFSLAVRAGDHSVPAPAGTLGYLDPGYTAAEGLSTGNDVYSFGVLLLEMLSSRKPVEAGREPACIVSWAGALIAEGRAKELCDGRVAGRLEGGMERAVGRAMGVALRCVSAEERRRPTMGEVVEEMRGAVEMCVSWPSWVRLRCEISRGARRCVRAWRRCKKKRVTGTTTKVVMCKDHLIGEDDEDEF